MEEKQLNIVEIRDVSLSKCCLVMEFCNFGSLEELVSGPRHYNWGRDEAGAFTVLRGLLHDQQYLQRIKIIHRLAVLLIFLFLQKPYLYQYFAQRGAP